MLALGIDPGKTTGYAMVELDSESRRIIPTRYFGNTKDMTLVDIRELIEEADYICYEGWRTFGDKAKQGKFDFQTMPAEQVIGSMRTLLRLRSSPPIQVHENLSGLKPVGYGFANMKYVKGKKGMHWQDALAHVVHFAVTKLGFLPVGLQNDA